MGRTIALELKVAITIRYLATESAFTDLQYQFRLNKSTISKFIPEVYEALKDKYMKVDKYVPLMKLVT